MTRQANREFISALAHSDEPIGELGRNVQLTIRDILGLLNVTGKSVYRWITGDDLLACRVNGRYRLNRAERLTAPAARKVNIAPSSFEEASEGALPDLAAAVQAGGINQRVGGADKPSALRAPVELLCLRNAVDREFLPQARQARESLASTGAGAGIASIGAGQARAAMQEVYP